MNPHPDAWSNRSDLLRVAVAWLIPFLGLGVPVSEADEASTSPAPASPAISSSATGPSLASSFSPRDGQWNIQWPGRLAQHDVVYLSPPEDPALGLPIGNGDLGALLWTTDHEIILAINKCDTWDDSQPGDFANWGREEEENYTTLRHGARLVLDFGCPVFDLLYQKDFQARIELASAKATLRAATPFAKVAVSAYLSAGHRVLVLRGEASGTEGYPRQIKLERWGSRVFGHWYALVVGDPTRGLDGTATAIEKNRIVITQKLRNLSFALAAPVIPAGVIGLSQQGTELFAAAVTQVRLHPKTDPNPVPGKPGTRSDSGELCMGWCPYPIALARLGLAEELSSELVNSISTWQLYPQGFGHYGPYHVVKPANDNRWLLNQVRDATKADDKTFPMPTWPFRHFDHETMPILAAAINEMLLQSYEGFIRICPSVPASWEVRFDLVAEDGFRVNAERSQGKVQWVSIESRFGKPCRLVHPWLSDGAVTCLDLSSGNPPQRVALSEESLGNSRILSWSTVAGHRYLLVRRENDWEGWKIVPTSPQPQTGPRHLKQAILGRDRLY